MGCRKGETGKASRRPKAGGVGARLVAGRKRFWEVKQNLSAEGSPFRREVLSLRGALVSQNPSKHWPCAGLAQILCKNSVGCLWLPEPRWPFEFSPHQEACKVCLRCSSIFAVSNCCRSSYPAGPPPSNPPRRVPASLERLVLSLSIFHPFPSLTLTLSMASDR